MINPTEHIKKHLKDNGIKQTKLYENSENLFCTLNQHKVTQILNDKRKMSANEFVQILDNLGLTIDIKKK
jgi:hypothetical protein